MNFLSYNHIRWEYELIGTGPETLFAFHGFGRHSSDFKAFEPALGKKYTIVSINLSYHGNSFTPRDVGHRGMSHEELTGLLESYLRPANIQRFSLMGYSLGGKIALLLLAHFPQKINDVFIISPDGIGENAWFSFSSRTLLGRWIFRRIVKHPGWFFRLTGWLKNRGLLHEKLYLFMMGQLDTFPKREQVYHIWLIFRRFKLDLPKIAAILNQSSIRFHLFYGKYDRVIPPVRGERFVKRLKNKTCLHMVESGHRLVNEKMNAELDRIVNGAPGSIGTSHPF